jgi:asparagine synthase (glutamine-hydrolysing)
MFQALREAVKTRMEISGLKELSNGDRDIIKRIKARKLTYLSVRRLESLITTCRATEENNVPGLFIEAGCALGGSAALIASIKVFERRFQVYDVFTMIPPPTKDDTEDVRDRYQSIVKGESKGLGGDKYYGYQEDLYEKVRSNLEGFGIALSAQHVTLIKGLLQDTLAVGEPVAFAHIDVDWYDPVMTCLTRLYPNLSVGGSIILDDYYDWGACRKAADEFLRGHDGTYVLDGRAGSLKITRVAI